MRTRQVIRREIGDRMRIARDGDRYQQQEQEEQQCNMRDVTSVRLNVEQTQLLGAKWRFETK